MSLTIAITGGTGGIGQFTAIGLAKTGARILVTGRNAERGEAAAQAIASASGNEAVEFVRGDLSTRQGALDLGAAIAARTERLDVLINNAGMLAQERTVNADGFELDFAVNVVAPYTLTHALREVLKAGAPSRVLVLTGGTPSGSFDASDLQSEKGFVPLPSYTMTKRAEEAMSLVLAKELEADGIGVHVVYPGRAATAMTRAMTMKSLPWHLRLAYPLFRILIPKEDGGKSAEKASKSSVHAATTSELEGKSGLYIDMNSALAKLHPTVMDPANQAKVLAAIQGGA